MPRVGFSGRVDSSIAVMLASCSHLSVMQATPKGTAPFMRQHYHQPFTLACQPNRVCWLKMQTHANAGVYAYETPRRGCIEGATKAKNECIQFPLTLIRTHKRSPSLSRPLPHDGMCRVCMALGPRHHDHPYTPTLTHKWVLCPRSDAASDHRSAIAALNNAEG